MNEGGARGDGESLIGPCAAWALSAAPFFFSVEVWDGVSRTALAALPWVAYAGLPRRGSGAGARGLALEIALCLPTLALGAWIDLADGRASGAVFALAALALVFLSSLSFAARATARLEWTRIVWSVAWFGFVAGVPILAALLALRDSSGAGWTPSWLAPLSRSSPLAWIVEALTSEEETHAIPWAPIASVAALLAFACFASVRAKGVGDDGAHGSDGSEVSSFGFDEPDPRAPASREVKS